MQIKIIQIHLVKLENYLLHVVYQHPEDYEGGELEFDFRNMDPDKPTIRKCAEIKPRGSIVVFPSHVWHRVKPVTKGTRYSLVIWNLGYPFK
jgi:PKHD-type hydroxylase